MESRKLKVLQFICPTGFYGAERWVLALAKHLPKDQVVSELAVTLEENSRDLELVKQFRKHCGEAHEVPMKNKFDLGVIDKLVKLIKERGIDIIHTHGYKSDILGVWAARKAGIKVVVTPHGFENARDFKLRTFIWLGCQAMKYADAVAPLSKQLVEDVRRFKVAEGKITYIQNGVDLSEVDEVRTQGPKAEAEIKTVGFIGQMISRKNIFDILDIFDQLQQKHGKLQLQLLGDGDERAALEAHTSQLTSREDIHFLGFRDDRLALLKGFDLFVMTSTLEGIPRCLMEACAMGTPVAAYDIAGIDQLLSHQDTGLLAELGDKQGLAEHWEKLLFDREYAQQIGENARQYVWQHYSAQRMADEYLDLFRQLMG